MNTISLLFKSLSNHKLGKVYSIIVFFVAMLLFLAPSSVALAANSYCASMYGEIIFSYDSTHNEYEASIPPDHIIPSGDVYVVTPPQNSWDDLADAVRDHLSLAGFTEILYNEPDPVSATYWYEGYMCFSRPTSSLNAMVEDFNLDEYIEGPFTMDYGDSTYINWAGSNVYNCSINQGIGSVSSSGYKYVTPTEDTTYTVTCDNNTGGTISDSVTINVTGGPAIDPPTADIKANGLSSITITKGTGLTLSWTTTNATSRYIETSTGDENDDVGLVDEDGNMPISPSQTTIYTILASNGSTDVTAFTTVNVQPAVATVSLSSNVSSILSGNSATLTYSGNNIVAGSCAISPSIGTVSGTSGTASASPTTSTTYTITCTGDSTTDGETVSDSVSVIVYPRVTANISASRTTINPGGSTTVSWSSTNADSCVGTNFTTGNAQSGSTSKTPTTTTTYSVTCTNSFDASDTATDSVTVAVETLTPSVSLTPSYQNIVRGSAANLTYTGNNIVPGSCVINQGYGSVSGTSGTILVNPIYSTSYTITCQGTVAAGSETVSDSATVNVTTYTASLDIKGDGPNDSSYTDTPQPINPGQSVSLRWTGSYINGNCKINGLPVNSPTSYMTVSPSSDATYTITCDKTASAGGGTISDSINIAVDTLQAKLDLKGEGPGDADYTDNPATINPSQSVSLRWTGTNIATDSCELNSASVADPTAYSTVSPNTNTTYTITCNKTTAAGGGSISDSIIVPVQTLTASVSLSDSPDPILVGDSTTLTYLGNRIIAGSCAISPSVGTVSGTSGTTSASPTVSTTYTITCTGDATTDGETVSDSTSVTVYPRVVADIKADGSDGPVTIDYGDSTNVSWSSSYASSCVGTNITTLGSPSGSSSKTPSTTTTYSVTCTNTFDASDTDTDSVTVNVDIPPATISLSSSPTSVFSNEASTLSWNSTNTSNCSIDQGEGSVSTSGSTTVYPSSSTTYTLTCDADAGGQVSDTATVSVSSNPSVDLKIDGQDSNQTITLTDSIAITWSSSNVDSCTNNFSGTPTTGGSKTESPSSTKTYSISCNRTVGGVTKTVTDDITVTVGVDPSSLDLRAQGPDDASPTNTPATIDNGDSVTLSWSGSNIASGTCELNGSSTNNPPASTTVSPSSSITYTLTCDKSASAGGGTITDSVTVQVYPSPTVDLKVNGFDGPITIDFEELARITWNSAYSSSCTGTNFTTYGVTDGSSDKYPQTTVTYSVTCDSQFNSETATDSVVVNVNAPTVAPSCGAADGQDLFSHPSDPDLCATGTSSDTPDGSGTYDWECTQITFPSVSCSANAISDGGGDSSYFCGSSEDGFYATAPTDPGLCSNGSSASSVGTVTSGGMQYWDWDCTLTDGLGSSNSSDCQAYQRPICDSSTPNACNPSGAVSEDETTTPDSFEWSCFYDYSEIVSDNEHSSSPCNYSCPEGEIIQAGSCTNAGGVEITAFGPNDGVINKGDSCDLDWSVNISDIAGGSVTCSLTGYDTDTETYSSDGTSYGSHTSTNVQSRAAYTLTCSVDGAPAVPGVTQDTAEATCIINPDIDEF